MHRMFLFFALLFPNVAHADPLHGRIDAIIEAKAKGAALSELVDDAGFLRRVYLDLAGTIPTAEQTRKFLDDKTTDKRAKLIDQLLAAPTYARRMADVFHVMLMERMGDHADWSAYLEKSFAANKPFDVMVSEMLRAKLRDEETRGAGYFLALRLSNYGQNPVDYPGLTRDIGRLFLGKNLQCAQCHNHLTVKEYKQEDFQGLFVFTQNAYLVDLPSMTVGEKPLSAKTPFQSVFGKDKKETGPRLPGGKEIDIPKLTKETMYVKPPEPKAKFPGEMRFSPLAELSREVVASPDFSRNIANRLWWVMMGRGLVHPLDLHHKDNPASHPELLELLAKEFVAQKHDIKWLLREIALTKTYQRSSELPEGATKLDPTKFVTALERRLSAEQMLWATLTAAGEHDNIALASKGTDKTAPLVQTRAKFLKAYAGPVREPEDELNPSLKGALFVLNDPMVLAWLTPRQGNLISRLEKLKDEQIADELYLSVLTRLPDKDEREAVTKTLTGKDAKTRQATLGRLAWALLASTEFGVNH